MFTPFVYLDTSPEVITEAFTEAGLVMDKDKEQAVKVILLNSLPVRTPYFVNVVVVWLELNSAFQP